ncbi:hypothetical protein HSBAA_48140 [Vreelandella sulfidaeris]|uniref:nicotinate-nucleotide diphosphorylase (carboxylating) n=1 Tax=Vreelandella sulfidaeris TaxID=115553 RepID=A0A455UGR7_9GAMM|nr:hypothetical protein HSBAA_48140 [Halomonas sulfidaeris]
MYKIDKNMLDEAARRNAIAALEEDIGSGDITARLVSGMCEAEASIITKEDAVVCGTTWVDEIFKQIDPRVEIEWKVKDSDCVTAGQTLCDMSGNARSLLSGERSALNFLQALSGTATRSRYFSG